jgi:hypothetical protein
MPVNKALYVEGTGATEEELLEESIDKLLKKLNKNKA